MKSNLIEFALKNYGVHETPDPNTANPKVLQFFADSGNAWVKDDTNYAWCAAFAGAAAKNCGYPITGSLQARSWLNAGQPVDKPDIGDFVIFWRDDINGPNGHVSLYVGDCPDGVNIYVLGGNQSNEVNISKYPKARVLGYRDITKPWPKFLFRADLKQGSLGEDVRRLQSALSIPVDGDFGPVTKAAVIKYQALHGLQPDGVVGKDTRASLNK